MKRHKVVAKPESRTHKIFRFAKRYKMVLIVATVIVLARVPLPGKTGEATSLMARAVTKKYAEVACNHKRQSTFEQAARRIVVGLPCPGDKDLFSADVVSNMVDEVLPDRKPEASASKRAKSEVRTTTAAKAAKRRKNQAAGAAN